MSDTVTTPGGVPPSEVEALRRIKLLSEEWWPMADIMRVYGTPDMSHDRPDFLVCYETRIREWGKKSKQDVVFKKGPDGSTFVNRIRLESAVKDTDKLFVVDAAVGYAMTPFSYKIILHLWEGARWYALSEFSYHWLVSERLHRKFPGAHATPGYRRVGMHADLLKEFKEHKFEIPEIVPLLCPIRDEHRGPDEHEATELDIVTGEPFCRNHRVFLEGRSVSCPRDSISWTTFERYRENFNVRDNDIPHHLKIPSPCNGKCPKCCGHE